MAHNMAHGVGRDNVQLVDTDSYLIGSGEYYHEDDYEHHKGYMVIHSPRPN